MGATMRSVRTLAVLCSALFGSGQSQVHRTCSTTSIFPTYGWVTTNGSTVPYTFTFPQTVTSSRAVTTSGNAPQQSSSGNLPPTQYPSQSTTATGTAAQTSSACNVPTQAPLLCPLANQTLYTPYRGCVSSNAEFTVVCARELDGQVIDRYEGVETVEACIALCADNINCDAVSYDMGSKSCEHKDDVYFGNPSSNPDLICAYRLVNYLPPQYTGGATTSSAPGPPIYTSNGAPTTSSVVPIITTTTSSASVSSTLVITPSIVSPTSTPAQIQSTTISVSSSRILSSTAQSSTIPIIDSSISSIVISTTRSSSSSVILFSTSSSAATSSGLVASSESPPPIYIPPSSSVPVSSSILSSTSLPIIVGSASSGVPTSSSSAITSSGISTTSSFPAIITPSFTSSTSSDLVVIPVTTSVSTSTSTSSGASTSSTESLSSPSLPPIYTPPILVSSTLVSSPSLSPSATTSTSVEIPPIYTPPTSTEIPPSYVPPTISSLSTLTSLETSLAIVTTTTTTTTSAMSSSTEVPPSYVPPTSPISTEIPSSYAPPTSPISTELPPSYIPPTISELSTTTSLEISSAIVTTTITSVSSSSSPVVVTTPPIYEETSTTVSSNEPGSTSPPAYLVGQRTCTNGSVETGLEGGARPYNINCPSDTTGSGGTAFLQRDYELGDYLQCADLCDDTPECSVWVFSQGEDPTLNPGGACYLKKAPQRPAPGPPGPDMVAGILVGAPGEPPTTPSQVYPEPGPCPGSNGEVSPDLEGNLYTTYCDMDSTPVSYNFTGAPSIGACIDYCRLDSGCGAIVYLPGDEAVDDGTCYFKPYPDTMYANPGSRLAVRVPTGGTATSSTTSSVSSATPTPTAPGLSCPADDGEIYIDPVGNTYTIYCETDSSPESFETVPASSYQACIDSCGLTATFCGAATYLPGAEGADGTCYHKPSPDNTYTFPGVWLAVRSTD